MKRENETKQTGPINRRVEIARDRWGERDGKSESRVRIKMSPGHPTWWTPRKRRQSGLKWI